MKIAPVSFFDKFSVWLFGQVVWRFVYRTAFTRRIFHRIFFLFFKNEANVKQIFGQKLRINPNRSVLEMKLHLLGAYEPEVVEYFRNNLKAGMTVVDIGANIGLFSLMAAHLVGDRGRVIAYEPHPETFAELCSNIALNDYHNITPVQSAISSQGGKLQINICADCDLNTVALEADCDSIEVSCQTLDASLEELGVVNCDLIKMDIEGAELLAIQGMDRTLARNPMLTLLVELHDSQIHALGGTRVDILDFFLKNGFKLYELNMWHGKVALHSIHQARFHGHLLCLREPPSSGPSIKEI